MAGIYLERKIKGKTLLTVSEYTVLGALARYITTENKDFEPMNANFGILPPTGRIIKDKAERKRAQAQRSLDAIAEFKKEIEND
jgi:methylenetetrahydrofolate--tRNA-(uracil-5-)-methyltransferase